MAPHTEFAVTVCQHFHFSAVASNPCYKHPCIRSCNKTTRCTLCSLFIALLEAYAVSLKAALFRKKFAKIRVLKFLKFFFDENLPRVMGYHGIPNSTLYSGSFRGDSPQTDGRTDGRTDAILKPTSFRSALFGYPTPSGFDKIKSKQNRSNSIFIGNQNQDD